jgi:hypothetical protein
MDNSTNRLAWGLQPPEGTRTAWGARAIFENGNIDIVWDRTSTFGIEKNIRKLTAWLDKGGLRGIRKEVKRLLPSDSTSVSFTSRGYIILANPRKSFGYLYLVSYSTREVEPEPILPTQDDINEGINIKEGEVIEAWYNRDVIVRASTYQTLFRKLKKLSVDLGCPRIFSVNDHGNVTEYSYTGRVIGEWV